MIHSAVSLLIGNVDKWCLILGGQFRPPPHPHKIEHNLSKFPTHCTVYHLLSKAQLNKWGLMHFCLIFFFLSRQYTNHQRPPPGPPTNGMTPPSQPGQPGQPGQAGQPPPKQPPPVQPPPQRHHQQPSPNENMYANLGQHPQLPPNFQR